MLLVPITRFNLEYIYIFVFSPFFPLLSVSSLFLDSLLKCASIHYDKLFSSLISFRVRVFDEYEVNVSATMLNKVAFRQNSFEW